MKAHRTLVIRRPLRIFNEEERNALVRVLTRVDALGNLWARGYAIYPPDLDSRFVDKFNYFRNEISFSNGVKPPKAWFARIHAMLNVGLRVSNERDMSQGVFIDLTKNVLRLRWVIKGRAIIINLTEGETKYIRERLSEGGKPKLAMAWVEDGYLYVAVALERDVEPIRPSEYRLVIDINSWRNGIVWGLIKDSSIASLGRERPDLERVRRLYNEVVELERKYGKLKRIGSDDSIVGKRIRRNARAIRRKLYAYLRDYAQKLVHKLVRKATRYRALVVIDDMFEESRRELLEEGLNNGLTKIYLAGLRRFVKLLTNQLTWYGIPYEFRRLPSTKCPQCGHELVQSHGRIMTCQHCGYKENRDLIPIRWALRLKAKFMKAGFVKSYFNDVL